MTHRIPEGAVTSEISRYNSRWPGPWSIEVDPGTNRAAIFDRNKVLVMRGINVDKARVIIGAVNRDYRAATES